RERLERRRPEPRAVVLDDELDHVVAAALGAAGTRAREGDLDARGALAERALAGVAEQVVGDAAEAPRAAQDRDVDAADVPELDALVGEGRADAAHRLLEHVGEGDGLTGRGVV